MLILKDGTIIEDGQAGYDEGFLWLSTFSYSMAQAASIFLDPAKTETIIFRYGEDMEATYQGYTDCINISINNDGKLSVCLRKGVA